MKKRPDLWEVLARNLAFFMAKSGYKNPNALAIAAKVAPNTVRNYLNHTKRTTTAAKPIGSPRLDLLEPLAAKLNCEVWELLHPNIEKSILERVTYKNWENSFLRLTDKQRLAIINEARENN